MPSAVSRPPAAPLSRARRARAPRPADGTDREAVAAAALDSIRRVVRALRVAAGRVEEATGLSAAQLFVLQQVAAAPGLSLTALAERTLTDRTSVAAVVERLHARGLVERARAAADRRRVEIRPTRRGARLLARAPHAPTQRVLDAMAALDDRELRRLAAGLAGLTRAMGLADEPARMLFEDGDERAADGVAGRRTARARSTRG
jgi:DNA-binding MarR family transcriptional regulator